MINNLEFLIQLQPLPLYNKLLVILINIIGVILAFVVYKNNPRAGLNRIFLFMSFLMLTWVDFAFLARLIGKSQLYLSETFLRVAWFATPLFFGFLYLLVVYLTGKQKEYKILSIFLIAISFITSVVTGFSNLVIEGISFFNNIDLRINYGIGMFPFLGIILFFIIAALYPLRKTYLSSSLELRKKIEYFISGIFIFYSANFIFNISLPVFFDVVRFYWIGDYSTIFLLGFISYAIIKQELFGIKVLLTQALVIIIAVLLFWQTIVAIPDWFDFSWRLSLFSLFLMFGYFLVRSVIREIEQKEEIAKMAKELESAYIIEKRAKEELQKIDAIKDQFLLTTQHDLRRPLTGVKWFLDMMLRGVLGKQNKKTLEGAKRIQESVDDSIDQVNNFLDIAQFQMGKSGVELKPGVELLSILQSIVNRLKTLAEEKEIYLKFDPPLPVRQEANGVRARAPNENFKIEADAVKLRAALLNIIDNAIKYTLKGGVTIKIKNQISNIKIMVEDTGIGIPKEKVNTIFENMFERTEEAKRTTAMGRGIGLYLSSQIIKAHNGRIWAESEGEGRGSTFYIELPLKSN